MNVAFFNKKIDIYLFYYYNTTDRTIMMRKHRYLYVLEDSKKHDLDFEKPSKTTSKIRNIVKTVREDTHKISYNLYAISLGYDPPNILTY